MIRLTINVSDIAVVISVYSYIRIYRSTTETGTYTHLDYVPLVAGQSVYTYADTDGTVDHWYKSS